MLLNPRLIRHGAGLVAVGVLLGSYGTGALGLNAASTVTAYVFTLLLVFALIWGPIRVLRGQRVSANSYTRRDLGIWSAVFGLTHLWLGLEEAMSQPYAQRFVEAASEPPSEEVRRMLFRWGVWSGLVAAAFLVVLLLLSNDWSLRVLGVRRWKWFQRSSYVVLALVVIHGWTYQVLERRSVVWVVVFASLATVAIVLQVLARRKRRATEWVTPSSRVR